MATTIKLKSEPKNNTHIKKQSLLVTYLRRLKDRNKADSETYLRPSYFDFIDYQ